MTENKRFSIAVDSNNHKSIWDSERIEEEPLLCLNRFDELWGVDEVCDLLNKQEEMIQSQTKQLQKQHRVIEEQDKRITELEKEIKDTWRKYEDAHGISIRNTDWYWGDV